MPRIFTLAQLRDRVRELVDAQESRFLSDTEVNKRLSSAYAKYYTKLVKAGLGYPGEVTQTITTTGTDTYPLDAAHFATFRVDFQYSTNFWMPLEELDIRELDRVQYTGAWQAFWYRLVGSSIILYPLPQTGGLYRHIYAPAPADLTSDSQTVDGVAGWEDAVVLDAAIRCSMKWEGDTSGLERERDRVDARIDEEAEMRSLSKPKHIVRRRHRVDEFGNERPFDPGDWPPWVR